MCLVCAMGKVRRTVGKLVQGMRRPREAQPTAEVTHAPETGPSPQLPVTLAHGSSWESLPPLVMEYLRQLVAVGAPRVLLRAIWMISAAAGIDQHLDALETFAGRGEVTRALTRAGYTAMSFEVRYHSLQYDFCGNWGSAVLSGWVPRVRTELRAQTHLCAAVGRGSTEPLPSAGLPHRWVTKNHHLCKPATLWLPGWHYCFLCSLLGVCGGY